jgi:hypothetical protein
MPDSAKRIKSNYQHNRNNQYAVTKATDSFSQEHFKLPEDGHTLSETCWSFNDGPQIFLTSALKKCVLRVFKT